MHFDISNWCTYAIHVHTGILSFYLQLSSKFFQFDQSLRLLGKISLIQKNVKPSLCDFF